MPSLRNFITRVPVQLLQEFLGKNGIELSDDTFSKNVNQIVEAIEFRLTELPHGTLGRLEQQIEKVDKLANEPGEAAIDAMTVNESPVEQPSRHARSLYVLLKDPEGFKRAEDVFYNDTRRRGRQWTAFDMEIGKSVKADEASRQALIAALRDFFDTQNVEIDVFERTRATRSDIRETDAEGGESGTRLFQITIYSEDRPNEDLAFVEGILATRMRYPVIEAAVTYEPATGIIECVARQRDKRAEVVRLVASHLLGASSDFRPAEARTYDLSVLSQWNSFATDPTDRIERVDVTMMRLFAIGGSAELITVENPAKADRDIWRVIDERLGPTALASDYHISRARIVIRYRTSEGNRVRSLPITITHPHRSDLKELLEIERVVATKYLPRWGLVTA